MSAENETIQDSRKWAGRPVVSFLLRTAVYVVPIVASVVFSIWLSRRLPRPDTLLGIFGWFALLVAVSTIVLFVADKLMRKMLPLAALLAVSMVFPDQSPSRFKTALRSGSSVKNLKALIAEAEALDETDVSQSAELVLSLTTALNAHDPRTRGHAERVRAYTDMLAEEMGLTEEERAKLRWASVLHDIGKLKVSSDILNKPGKLNDQEWVEIKQHPVYGESICGPLLEWLGEWSGAIRHHHERFDGNGYPDGLKGEEISRAGRIVCVADAYDVMTTIRSYKKPMPNDEAREELARHAGTQFDPEVVRAFLKISMGRLRWVAGPLSWLTQLPFLNVLGGVAQNVGTTVGVAAAAGTVSAAVIGAGIVELPVQGLDLLPVPETLQQYDTEAPLVAPTPPPPAGAGVAANNDRFEVAGASPVTLDILANDVGVNGATIAVVTQPGFGTVIVNANGTVTYIPADGYTGPDRFTYQVTNADGSSAQGVVDLGVLNTPPVANADTAELDEDSSVVIDVLANDTDTEGLDPATLKITVLPANGVATVLTEGRIRYVPVADFEGTDTLTYSITDLGGLSSEAVVTITVRPVNDPPEIRGEFASVVEDGVAVVNVVANDTDPDGTIDPATLIVTSPPIFGTATASSNGTITYAPFANINGTDIIVYRVCDSGGACGTANLVMTISAVNDPPTAPGPGVLNVTEDETASFDPLAGAADVDGNTVTLHSFDPVSAAGGTIAEGSLIYTPPANYSGVDTFSYRITDGTVVVSILVTVNVTDIQHPPVPGAVPGVVEEDSFLIADPAGAASDADGDTITLTAVTQPTNGVVAINPDGTITYTPTADFVGTDSFTYTITDGVTPVMATVATTVTNVNDVPVAIDDSASVVEDAPSHDIDVLANDSDIDGDALSATADLTGLTGGTVTDLGGGVYRFVPDLNFDAIATFSVVVNDGNGGTDSSTVTLTMIPLPDDPVAADDLVTLDEDASAVISPLGNDTDPDTGDSFSITGVDMTGIIEGALVNNGDGTLTYTAGADHNGVESFTYTITDTTGRSDSATVTITIDPVPDAPIAGTDGYLTDQNTTITVVAPGLLGNDIDHDDDPLAVDVAPASLPLHGTLTLGGDGSFTYVPDSGYTGTDTFTYIVRDPGGLSDIGTATVTVNSGTLGGFLYLGATPDPSGDFVLSTTPPAAGPPLEPVPDLDGDGNPGVTVIAGDGDITEPDPAKVLTWSYAPPAAFELDGPFFLDLWSTAAGFMPFDPGHIVMYILDCDSADWGSCTTLIDSDTHRGDWNAGSTTWVNEIFTIGSIQHTVNVGRTLVLRVQFKHNDVWIANTTDYPSRFVFTQANRPPVANDDAYPGPSDPLYLEESPLVNIDVAANDFDADLDLATLSIAAPPGAGTAFARADGTIDYTPDTDAYGLDSLLYEICDTNGACSTATLTVDVTPVNDVPSYSQGPNVTVLEDAGNHSVAWATAILLGPPNESAQKLRNLSGEEKFEVVVPVGSEAAMFDELPSIDKNGTLKFKTADNANGTANVDVSLRDDGGVANGGVDQTVVDTFKIKFTAVNDEPSFTAGADVIVAEDSPAYTSGTPWATAISMGPADESAQTADFFVASNDNPGLFSVQPALDDAGFLTFTPAADAEGRARIDVYLMDDGGIADGGDDTSPTQRLDIEITAVNDQPALDPIGDEAEDEDSGIHTTPLSGIDAGGGEADTLTITAVSSNPAIVADPAVTYSSPNPTGTLTWSPVADAFGSVTITVTVDDNSGAPNATIVQTFDIAIAPINDQPTIDAIADVVIGEDPGTQSTPLAGITAGGGEPDSLTVTATSSNPALVPDPTVTYTSPDTTGSLTWTPVLNATGTATITVTVDDNTGGPDDTVDTTFTITVTPVNDPPTVVPAGPFSVVENSPATTPVGVVTATDPDSPVTGYAIASGDAAGVFTISATGAITVANPATLDYEGITSYSLGITATDGIDTSDPETVVVDVVDVNDTAPTVTPGQIMSVPENAPDTTTVGTVAATDPDSPVTGFNITGGDPSGVFGIDAAGEITVVDRTTLDFGTTPQYLLQVTATDGINTSVSEVVTVDVVDIAELILISELRTVGPTGSSDEFIELYNASSVPVNIEGWEIRVDDANLLQVATIVIDSNDDGAATSAVVPANGFYLLGGALYTGGPAPDQTFLWDITMGAGIGLYDATSNPIDAVGTSPAWKSGAGALYVEGTPLAPIDGFQDHSYQRRNGDAFGACLDSDDNAADFVHLLDQSTPRNSSSPVQPCAAPTPPPPVVPPLSIVISEFRIDGPTGGNDDQFVEFFNPTGVAISMSGWSLWLNEPASASLMFSFGPTAVIPPGNHLLLAGGGYSSPTLVLPDAYFDVNGPTPYGLASNKTAKDTDGFILVMGGDPGVDPIADAVALNAAAYVLEGPHLPPLGGRVIQSYERIGGCRDTNDNRLDFFHNVASEKPQNLSSAAESC